MNDRIHQELKATIQSELKRLMTAHQAHFDAWRSYWQKRWAKRQIISKRRSRRFLSRLHRHTILSLASVVLFGAAWSLTGFWWMRKIETGLERDRSQIQALVQQEQLLAKSRASETAAIQRTLDHLEARLTFHLDSNPDSPPTFQTADGRTFVIWNKVPQEAPDGAWWLSMIEQITARPEK